MVLTGYQLFYILSNIFGVYIIFLFMKVFFDDKRTTGRIEFISYAIYYLIISILYLYTNIPFLFMIVSIVSFFCLTFNYESGFKRRIIAVAYIYMILMAVETIVAIVSGYTGRDIFNNNTHYSSILGLVAVRIISFIIVLLLKLRKNIKKGVHVLGHYWFAILFIPFSTLYLTIIILSSTELGIYPIIISILLLLAINFTVFYLYDALSISMEEKFQKSFLEQENIYYNKQFEMMKNSLQTVSLLKHDMKNHIHAFNMLLKSNQMEKAREYVSQFTNVIEKHETTVNSGNIVIDSILNYKVQEAQDKDINVSLNISVPENLDVESFDLVAILSNLLDNAINAVLKINNNRNISLTVKYDKGTIFIEIENTYDGKVFYEGARIVTSNMDKENHGKGLESIRSVLKKYNGTLELSHTSEIFTAIVIIYMNKGKSI